MNYGLGSAMMQRDGAPQQMMQPQMGAGGVGGLFGNMGAQNNDWLAQAMMMGQKQQQAPQQKKKGFLEQLIAGGGLGILPALLGKL